MSEFKIRPYSKSQLATIYFPGSTEMAVRRHLSRWIARNKQLCESLESTNYRVSNRWYTPHQVRLIVECLGEP